MRYTSGTLKKIEELFAALQYTIRYEKGSFQSGYCLVENKNIAVINRFLDTESRINALMEILSRMDIDPTTLDEKAADFYQKLKNNMPIPEAAEESVASTKA